MPELYNKLFEWHKNGVAVIKLAPDWLLVLIAALVPIVLVLAVFMTIFALLTWVERKALGRIQNRYGPNRVGPVGLFQPVADGIKMLCKEDIIPARADKLLHFLAPVAMLVPALLIYSVLPYGRDMVPADLGIGVLFVFAVGSFSALAVFAAGWSGRNKYSLLGAMRGVAQMISYEVPLVLSVIAVVMIVGSLQTTDIVHAQSGAVWNWFVWTPWGFLGFVIFTLASVAEVNRSPFDLPEAESEIIAGYHTEYSGFKFAIFQMAEYLAAMAMSGVGVTLFLGGWSGPWAGAGLLGEFLSLFYFLAKMLSIMFFMIWLRGTFPRLRVDQLMGFAWKQLLPLSLFNVFVAGLWHYMAGHLGQYAIVWAWLASTVLVALAYLVVSRFTEKATIERRTYRYANLT